MSAVTPTILLARMMEERLSAEGGAVRRGARKEAVRDSGTAIRLIQERLSDLRAAMRRAMPVQRSALWSRLFRAEVPLAGGEQTGKRSFVAAALKACAPRHVLDVGCNTGMYSRLAEQTGAEVVAIDNDAPLLERLCGEIERTQENILPLCVDLTDPTAGPSFVSRAEGYFDTVMMLAGTHNLLLSRQVSLKHIVSLCSRMTTRNLILEWAPLSVVKESLQEPEALPGPGAIGLGITEDLFRDSFASCFDILQETRLADGRILFHMVKQ